MIINKQNKEINMKIYKLLIMIQIIKKKNIQIQKNQILIIKEIKMITNNKIMSIKEINMIINNIKIIIYQIQVIKIKIIMKK